VYPFVTPVAVNVGTTVASGFGLNPTVNETPGDLLSDESTLLNNPVKDE
jgi:hypothetical protein